MGDRSGAWISGNRNVGDQTCFQKTTTDDTEIRVLSGREETGREEAGDEETGLPESKECRWV